MMRFDVTPDGGDTFRVVAASRDVLAWEKAGKGRSFKQLGEEMTMAGLYGLSYFAARRQGLFSGTLPEWEESVDLMPVGDDDEDQDDGDGVDPTRSAPTPGNSSDSPSLPASRRASGRKKEPPR